MADMTNQRDKIVDPDEFAEPKTPRREEATEEDGIISRYLSIL